MWWYVVKKLTTKQKRFAEEYVKCGNATQAAINAGYSAKTAKQTGNRLLTNVDLKSYIDAISKRISKKTIMDAQEALELLTGIARGEIKETVFVSTGVDVYEKQKEADAKTRIAAIREILKRYPLTDPMIKEQLRKLKAEADIAECKAKSMSENSDRVAEKIDQLFDKVLEEVAKDDN